MNIYSPNPNDEFFIDLKNKISSIDISDSNPKIASGWNWTGKNHSEETKLLLSKLNSGKNNPMFGKKLTEEQRKKISLSQLGRPLSEKHKQAISLSKIGIPRSEETKRKISEARRKTKQ
jgi:hypothetical protein